MSETKFEAISRATDPETSHITAQEITRDGTVTGLRELVNEAVKVNPGLTSRELSLSTEGIAHESFHKRLPELERRRLVHRGDARRCRTTNRMATTWYPGPKGDPEQMDLI